MGIFTKKSGGAKDEFTSSMEKVTSLLSEEIQVYEAVIVTLNKKYNLDATPPIVNSILFFRISFRDIINAIKQLRNSTAKEDINLNSRSLALHLYEFLDDTKHFL